MCSPDGYVLLSPPKVVICTLLGQSPQPNTTMCLTVYSWFPALPEFSFIDIGYVLLGCPRFLEVRRVVLVGSVGYWVEVLGFVAI